MKTFKCITKDATYLQGKFSKNNVLVTQILLLNVWKSSTMKQSQLFFRFLMIELKRKRIQYSMIWITNQSTTTKKNRDVLEHSSGLFRGYNFLVVG
jgi:hypothetical protein